MDHGPFCGGVCCCFSAVDYSFGEEDSFLPEPWGSRRRLVLSKGVGETFGDVLLWHSPFPLCEVCLVRLVTGEDYLCDRCCEVLAV